MKKNLWLLLMISFLGIGVGCDKNSEQVSEIEKTELVEYCQSNGGFIGGTDILVCYFSNSSCLALDFYNGDCLPQEEVLIYDEELAVLYCKKSYGTVSEIDVGGGKEKICLFPNQSVCTLKDMFYGECDNEN